MHRFVELIVISFGSLLSEAVALVPAGAKLIAFAFLVLFQNEARPDFRDVLEQAQVAPANQAEGFEGEFVAVTGMLESEQAVGDPVFFEPGGFVQVVRVAQTYAWVETVSESSRRQWGGSREVETVVSYEMTWVDDPLPASAFRYPEGHENPRPAWRTQISASDNTRVGAWRYDPSSALLLAGRPLVPSEVRWTETGADLALAEDGWWYPSAVSPDGPRFGEQRVQFVVVPVGTTVTAFADARQGTLTPHEWVDGFGITLISPGERADTLEVAHSLYTLSLWIGRLGGAFGIWLGLMMIAGPVLVVLSIIPPVGAVAQWGLGLLFALVAIALAAVVASVSLVLHSPALLALAAVVAYVLIRSAVDRRRERREYMRIMAAWKGADA